MMTLSIDIETYSSTDIVKAGVYKYAAAHDFEVLLFGYAINDEPATVLDLASGERIPDEVEEMIDSPTVTKCAFNALFERTCLSKHLRRQLSPRSWDCTMVRAARLGLPLHLDGVAKAMNLPVQKDANGKKLIKLFSVPCKPTIKNGRRTRNLPMHFPSEWAAFKTYCGSDVDVERAGRRRLVQFPTTATEEAVYLLDQKINDRGMRVDMGLVRAAIKIDSETRKDLETEAILLTGLDNPNSAAQLKKWLSEDIGEEVETLRKADVPVLLQKVGSETAARVLGIRQEMAKTSVKKFEAMAVTAGLDNRIRGLFQYCGANRTWRWAGRLVQVQNLPQNHMEGADLTLARNIAASGDRFYLEMMYGNVPDTLSQLIRTAFVAPPGKKLVAVDFSSIELIVLAWLAGEKWVIDEFCGERKIYEQTAARMLGVPVASIGKKSPERQKGKISSLACQYGGGVNALIAMGALLMGLLEEELKPIVEAWRAASPATTKYWRDVERAAIAAVRTGETQYVGKIKFIYQKGLLFIELHSGRRLAYVRPRLVPGKYRDVLTYEGIDQKTKKWGRTSTWGGKITENIVQAEARDCLAEALLRLDDAGYDIVGHVHDEIIMEADDDSDCLADIIGIITRPIPWAPGLPLAAEGFENAYYKK